MTDEELTGSTANSQAGDRLDIVVNGVRAGTFERTYFVFNPHAPSNRHAIICKQSENMNKPRSTHKNNGY